MNGGTNVLVTGGARRIGRAIVEDLASHGFGVAIHFERSAAEAEHLVSELRGRGCHVSEVKADLTDRDAVEGLLDAATAAVGPVSIVVNNASVFEPDTAQSFDWPIWDRHFDVHLKAPVALASSLAALVPAGSEGLVVNIIDQRVLRLTPANFSYTLSKSSLWTATRTMAQALAPNVRVNAIGPGPTLPSSRQSAADFETQVGGLILRRSPSLAEFGATVRYLWEAKSVTGQMIALDGGQHLAWETPDVAGIAE